MTEKFPDDIMEAARNAYREGCKYPHGTPLADGGLITAIARAIRAERQRCTEAAMFWAKRMQEAMEGKEAGSGNAASEMTDADWDLARDAFLDNSKREDDDE